MKEVYRELNHKSFLSLRANRLKKRDAKLEGLRPNVDMPVRAMPASLPEDEKALEHHLGGFSTKKSRGACHENPVSSRPPAPRRVFFRL